MIVIPKHRKLLNYKAGECIGTRVSIGTPMLVRKTDADKSVLINHVVTDYTYDFRYRWWYNCRDVKHCREVYVCTLFTNI